MKPLKHDRKYLCRLINQEDGTKSKPLVCTPDELFDSIKEEAKNKSVPLDDFMNQFFIDFMADFQEVSALENEDKPMNDFILQHPLMKAHAYYYLFLTQKASKMPEKA